MTPEQQRIAIAEVCGWEPVSDDQLPNYLKDLNAMHEAEKTIKGTSSWRTYKYELSLMPIDEIHATAAQRAEAFLLTFGLWKIKNLRFSNN